MPISDRPWSDFPDSAFTPEQYCRAALLDLNAPGEPKAKDACHLPVLEPNGALNRAACHSAAAALSGARGGIKVGPDDRRRAARALIRRYGELNEDPPESLRRLAGG